MNLSDTRKRFRDSWLFRVGVLLLLLGSGPLLLIILFAKLGLTKDPNPNPILFGILAMFTFWPSLVLTGGGILSVMQQNWTKRRELARLSKPA